MEILIAVNYMPSKDNDEDCMMHSKRINIEIRINDKEDKAIEEHFWDFILDCVNLL